MAEVVEYSQENIQWGAELLRRGELVIFAPGTVYAVMADATNERATARIYALKQRPKINPLMAIVHSHEAARRIAVFDDTSEALAEHFWPGPLTLSLPIQPKADLARHCISKVKTVAVCVHDALNSNRILTALDRPVASSSANFSGWLSPTEASFIDRRIADGVRCIFDDGPAAVGIESTLLLMYSGHPILVRPGAIPTSEIECFLGRQLLTAEQLTDTRRLLDERAIVPTETLPHYGSELSLRLDATCAREGEILLGFGPSPSADFNLSEAGDLQEAARNLYSCLARIRHSGYHRVAVVSLPGNGLGATLRHRLKNAASSSRASDELAEPGGEV